MRTNKRTLVLLIILAVLIIVLTAIYNISPTSSGSEVSQIRLSDIGTTSKSDSPISEIKPQTKAASSQPDASQPSRKYIFDAVVVKIIGTKTTKRGVETQYIVATNSNLPERVDGNVEVSLLPPLNRSLVPMPGDGRTYEFTAVYDTDYSWYSVKSFGPVLQPGAEQ